MWGGSATPLPADPSGTGWVCIAPAGVLRRVAADGAVTTIAGYQRRTDVTPYHPTDPTIPIAAIHAGKIGAVKTAYATCYERRGSIVKVKEDTPVSDPVDYNLWSGPAPLLPTMRRNTHSAWPWVEACGNGHTGHQGVNPRGAARCGPSDTT